NSIVVSEPSPGRTVAVGRALTFTVTAPGFLHPIFTVFDSYSRSTVNTSDINTSGAFSWTPTLDDIGPHTLTISASDDYGHSAQTNQTITVINPVVLIESVKPGSGVPIGSPLSFTANTLSFTKPTFTVSDSFTG